MKFLYILFYLAQQVTLNKTGIVYAYQDKLTHVSVVPVGVSIQTWINAGSGSIWTQAVKSVVVKWDGGN